MSWRGTTRHGFNQAESIILSDLFLVDKPICCTFSPPQRRILWQFNDRCSPDCHKMRKGENPAFSATYGSRNRCFGHACGRDGGLEG